MSGISDGVSPCGCHKGGLCLSLAGALAAVVRLLPVVLIGLLCLDIHCGTGNCCIEPCHSDQSQVSDLGAVGTAYDLFLGSGHSGGDLPTGAATVNAGV